MNLAKTFNNYFVNYFVIQRSLVHRSTSVLTRSTRSSSTSSEGKKVLITGGNRGIGFATSRLLASKGYEVTFTSRNLNDGENATAEIKRTIPEANVNTVKLDLASLENVKDFANSLNGNKNFDVLILNAGVMLPENTTTIDGLETTFQVNYLSHFLLSHLLLQQQPTLKKIVIITSLNAKSVGIAPKIPAEAETWFDWFNDHERSPMTNYGMSKFALCLLAINLNKLDGLDCVAVHPGVVPTGISDRFNSRIRDFLKKIGANYIYISQDTAAEHVETAMTSSYLPGDFQEAHKVAKFSKFIRAEKNQESLEVMNKVILERYLNSQSDSVDQI